MYEAECHPSEYCSLIAAGWCLNTQATGSSPVGKPSTDQHQNTTYAVLQQEQHMLRFGGGFGAGLCCFFPAGSLHCPPEHKPHFHQGHWFLWSNIKKDILVFQLSKVVDGTKRWS